MVTAFHIYQRELFIPAARCGMVRLWLLRSTKIGIKGKEQIEKHLGPLNVRSSMILFIFCVAHKHVQQIN